MLSSPETMDDRGNLITFQQHTNLVLGQATFRCEVSRERTVPTPSEQLRCIATQGNSMFSNSTSAISSETARFEKGKRRVFSSMPV